MTKDRAVIFDFDGTLADTFLLAIDIFYKLKPKAIILPKKDVDRLRGMALLEVANEIKIPLWQIPWLLLRGRRMMTAEIGSVELINGMKQVVEELHSQGYKLYVVSSNSKNNIRKILEKHGLQKYFEGVYGNARLSGKHRVIKKLLKKQGIKLENAYYVGDEARDIISAKKAGVRSLAVTWGYNNIHALNEQAPDALVFDPVEILKEVNG